MQVTGLVYWVLDNKISEKFYKKLGFDILESDEGHSLVKLGDFEISLVGIRDESEFRNDAMTSEKGKGSYLYIQVEDVDRLYEKVSLLKLNSYSAPRDWEWGNREFIVKDPDGYKICFWQKIA
jgi:uncharacterized glyoxalase superfamily protein PhnB